MKNATGDGPRPQRHLHAAVGREILGFIALGSGITAISVRRYVYKNS